MKKHSIIHILFFFTLILFSLTGFCQAPQAIPYQAVARNNAGNILSNQSISLRFSVHDGASSGAIVYQETQNVTTNSLGLFSINLGQGTVVSGAMTSIDWKNGAKYLQVELDPTGGTTYTDMGTTQLMSVPFALHAASSSDNLWNQNGIDISNQNAGNVGIGISNPEAQVHIHDVAGAQNVPSANLLLSRHWINANDTRASSIFHYYNGNTYNDNLAFAVSGDGGNHATPKSLNQIKMMIQANGNVGIGTITPTSKLSVIDSLSNTAFNVDLAGGDALLQIQSPSSNHWTRLGTNASPLAILTQGSDKYGSNPSMFINNDGKIGIGTSAPKSLFDIRGDISMGAWHENNGARRIGIYDGIDFTGGMEIENTTLSGNYSQKVHFITHHVNNGYGRRMTVDENGNVGIGTTTPTSKFNVEQYGHGMVHTAGTTSVGTYADASAGWIGTNSYHPLYFYTGNGYESMAITTSGNVGIGTSTPNEKLSVIGTTGLYGNTVISPSQSGSLGTVSIGTPTLFANSMLNIKSNLQYGAFIDGANTGSAALYVTGITRLDGEVGINVAPSSVYQLAVGGKIVCTELRVQAMPFPDYVFDPSYKLKPLEEVEEHILAHHRLPNMPPATQVESEGMNVGGIQLKLVEKVEELTLYLLQQQKELKAQKEEINDLKMLLNNSKN